jgi:transposase
MLAFMQLFWYNYPMETQANLAEQLLEVIEEKDRKIAELEQRVEWFMAQFRLLRHKQFGVSSEQTGDTQLSIFNEAELCADITIPEPEISEVKAHYRKRTRLTTDKLPKDLPAQDN